MTTARDLLAAAYAAADSNPVPGGTAMTTVRYLLAQAWGHDCVKRGEPCEAVDEALATDHGKRLAEGYEAGQAALAQVALLREALAPDRLTRALVEIGLVEHGPRRYGQQGAPIASAAPATWGMALHRALVATETAAEAQR